MSVGIPILFQFAVLWLFAGWLLRRSPFYVSLLESQKMGRFPGLDGLRGLLAISVFLHHTRVIREFYAGGRWEMPVEPIERFLGPGAVLFFFFITAFLFWTKAIRGRITPGWLYVNRLKRLAPLFWFSSAVMGIFVAVASHFELHVFGLTLAKQVVRLFGLGILPWTPLNGIDTLALNAGVTWSLAYEWGFYLALPLGAWLFSRRPWVVYGLCAIPFLFSMPVVAERSFAFAFGMAAAQILAARPSWPEASGRVVTFASALILGLTIFAFGDYFKAGAYLACLAVFMPVLYGNDWLGLLSHPTTKFLGTISYSVYLLQGFVLRALLEPIEQRHGVAVLSGLQYVMVTTMIGCVLIWVASWTYRWIEHPWLRKT